MNAGLVPTMPDGLPQPQPVGDDIDPLLRLMRENQQLTERVKELEQKVQAYINEQLAMRKREVERIEKAMEAVRIKEQSGRRLAGQNVLLARALNQLWQCCPGAGEHTLKSEKWMLYTNARKQARELLDLLPPEMK